MSTELMPASAPAEIEPARSLILDGGALAQISAVADQMAKARITIPKHLQGNSGDCFAVAMQAAQWRMNPFVVAQKTHVVNGTLGYEAQLVNAVASSSPLLATRINYEWQGDWKGCNGKTDKSEDRACIVSARLRGETEPRSLRVSMAQVGNVRNSPLWESDPRQQLAYLATKRWARLHAPDALLGVYSVDELQDAAPVQPARVVATLAPAEQSHSAEPEVRALRTKMAGMFTSLGWDRQTQGEWIAGRYPDEAERTRAAHDPEALAAMIDALESILDIKSESEAEPPADDSDVPF